MSFRKVIIGFILLFSLASYAEYRAFLLEIYRVNQPEIKRFAISNLDDLQYPTYYPLVTGEGIRIVDTWMCWERSDFSDKVCPSPRQKQSLTQPEANPQQ